jgi:hypothetical protein
MMKLEMKNGRDWEGFSKLLEIMSFVDEIESSSPEQCREAAEKLCELPPNPGQTMSLEEVVFWAGVATGIEAWRQAEEGALDPISAERMLVFSSIFAHSTKSAIVDLALGQLDSEAQESWQDTGGKR